MVKYMKKTKAFFLIVLIVILSSVVISNFFTYRNSLKNDLKDSKKITDNKKIIKNKNKSFKKTKTIKNVTFSDIKCTFDGKDSLIKYVVSNRTDKKIHIDKYEALIKDKNKVLLTRILVDFSKDLNPGEKKAASDLVVGLDLTNAAYIDIEFKEK